MLTGVVTNILTEESWGIEKVSSVPGSEKAYGVLDT